MTPAPSTASSSSISASRSGVVPSAPSAFGCRFRLALIGAVKMCMCLL